MSDDVRSAIGDALTGFMTPEQVRKLIDEVLASEKSAMGDFVCKKCSQRQRHAVRIPDTTAVIRGLETLANQAWGRPSEQDKNAGGITFIREVTPPYESLGAGFGDRE